MVRSLRRSRLTILLSLALWLGHRCAAADVPATNSAKDHGQLAPDVVVAADGSGDVKTLQAAVDRAKEAASGHFVIFIKNGTYREKVRIDAAGVVLRGEDKTLTRIEYSQLNDDFEKKPDDIGKAVINANADDLVLENLTIANTAGIVGPHSFAIFGKGDRVVIQDCQILSEGADTVSLWRGDVGRYYHARCNFRGAVDFVCPRGWCYVTDCSFYETKATAAIWHDGSLGEDMKFVLRNCQFDGVEGFVLGRHHVDAQFYLLDCKFSEHMLDRPIKRVVYPIGNKPATDADRQRNADLDLKNQWGERAYFSNCHRAGGDFAWHADNLPAANGSPNAKEITPGWTFRGTWDPTKPSTPKVTSVKNSQDATEILFSEAVAVQGKLSLRLTDGSTLGFTGGSGTTSLRFDPLPSGAQITKLDTPDGAVLGCAAACYPVDAELALPAAAATK